MSICASRFITVIPDLYFKISRKSLWRNGLARSAVNRKVDGSNPSRDAFLRFVLFQKLLFKMFSDYTALQCLRN